MSASLVYPEATKEAFAQRLEEIAKSIRSGSFKPERLSHYVLRGQGNWKADVGSTARSLRSFKRYGFTLEWEDSSEKKS